MSNILQKIISFNYYKNMKGYKAHFNKWEHWGSEK